MRQVKFLRVDRNRNVSREGLENRKSVEGIISVVLI